METVRIARANSILRVNPQLVQSYLNQGYSVIDEKGNVLKEGLPQTPDQFKRGYFRLKEENEKLKAEIEELKSKASTAKKATKEK